MAFHGSFVLILFVGQSITCLTSALCRSRGLFHEDENLPGGPRILAVYVNDDRAVLKDNCMQSQMQEFEADPTRLRLIGARHSAVVFNSCENETSCIAEHPECFPQGSIGFIEKNRRAVLGHFCSHLSLIKLLMERRRSFDYFLILEDDILLMPGLIPKLTKLFALQRHWDIVALDNFKTGGAEDKIANDEGLNLYSMSAATWTYTGAHAWLVNADRLVRLENLFQSLPAVPNEVVLKTPRPLHVGVWSFTTGQIVHAADVKEANLSQLTAPCQVWVNAEMKRSAAPTEAFTRLPRLIPQLDHSFHSSALPDLYRPGQQQRELVIFGMYSSGTKMLADLVQKNLEYPNSISLCKNYTARGYCGNVWKHTHPNRVQELPSLRSPDAAPLRQIVAVVIVRHPFSVIRSLVRHSYDMSCAGGLVNETVDIGRPTRLASEPCMYVEPDAEFMASTQANMVRLPNATCERADGRTLDGHEPCWASLAEAWNSYIAGYAQLPVSDTFQRTVVLRYEDVVEFPMTAVRRIARAVGLPQPDHVENVERMLGRKGWGFAGRNVSLERLRSVGHAANTSCSDVREICKRLNPTLMHRFGYHGCETVWPGWREMIFGGSHMGQSRLTALRTSANFQEYKHWCSEDRAA